MALNVYTDAGGTTQALYTMTRPLIDLTGMGATGGIFETDSGYTKYSSSPQGGLVVAFLGILLSPLSQTQVDQNNVYIKIFPKGSGPAAALTAPITRRLYKDVDWAFVGNPATSINVNLSSTGPNADVAVYVGQGDLICISPTQRAIIPTVGAIGTTPSGDVPLYLARNDNYTYDYLQIYALDTFVNPPLVASIPLWDTVTYPIASTTVNTSAKTISITINNDTLGTKLGSNALAGYQLYWGNAMYAMIAASSYAASVLTLTLSRVPATENAIDNLCDYTLDMRAFDKSSNESVTWSVVDLTLANGTLTSGSTSLTVTSTTGVKNGMKLTHANLPANTYVQSVTNSTTIVMTQAASANASSASIGCKGSVSSGAFKNLDLADFTGYAVTHLAKFVGLVTGTGRVSPGDSTCYVTMGESMSHTVANVYYGEGATAADAATSELCELIRVCNVTFATTEGGLYAAVLDYPAISANGTNVFWAKGAQLVKSRPYISPNFQIIVTGLAFTS